MSDTAAVPPARNAACPCGSGLRYKSCCGAAEADASRAAPVAYPGWELLAESERKALTDWMREALAAQLVGEGERARELYERVLARAPDTFDALHMLGVLCLEAGELDRAYRSIRKALDLCHWSVEAMRRNLDLVVDAALARGAGAPGASEAPGTAWGVGAATAGEAPGSADPRVSVIVSTYNAAACLPACLEDLERQTIADALEVILIDSGSTQDERAIAQAYEPRFRRLLYLRTPRETLHAAWNRGIALSRARYVTNANTDDAHRPDALEMLAAALDANPDADYAYSDYVWTSRPNGSFDDAPITRTVRHHPYHPANAMFYCVLGCHPMWRRTLFDALGPFDAGLATIGDYELLLRAVRARRRPVHVPQPLSLFYQNPEGLTFRSDRAHRELTAMLNRHRDRMPIWSLYRIDPGDPAQVAAAWTALGVHATRLDVPWLDGPHRDMGYAMRCFQRALQAQPAHLPALCNLATAYAAEGRASEARLLLERIPTERAAPLAAALAQRRFVYESTPPAAAVAGLEYGRPSAPSSFA
jgi:tetratricopeptide (TPR) repeat protein